MQGSNGEKAENSPNKRSRRRRKPRNGRGNSQSDSNSANSNLFSPSGREFPPPPPGIFETLETGTFIVFDLETTGGNPERNGLTEIFALRYRNGVVEDTFYTMVNPGISIPPIVRRMTGITNAMVRDAPRIRDVMHQFVEFIGDDVMVSHNTIGDMKFVHYFAEKICQKQMTNFFVCTHLLSEKLVPEAPSKSLSGLAKFFEIPSGELHRAEGDAYLTLELFKALTAKLKAKGLLQIVDAIRLQGDLESGIRLGWGIDLDKHLPLATGAGVFYLYDKEKKLSFASSAVHLDREIGKLARFDQLPRQLVRLVLNSYDLKTEKYPNLFSALLHECTVMESHRKLFDPCKWHNRSLGCMSIIEHESTIRVSLNGIEEGTTQVYGPVRDRKGGNDIITAIARCFGTKDNREAVSLPKESAPFVTALFAGRLPQMLDDLKKKRFSISMLWRHRDRQQITKQQELIRELMKIEIPNGFSSLLDLNGITVVKDSEASSWQIFVVTRGIAKYHGTLRGNWELKINEEEFLKRIIDKIGFELESQHQSLSHKEARRAEATLWWIISGSKKADGAFVSLDELRAKQI